MPFLESAPSLRELAERLSLIQRWNGRTTIPWSVLQHTILAAALLPEDAHPALRLTVLLHDTAEGYTGDIPRGFKCPEQADMESDILAEIYQSQGLVAPSCCDSELRYYDDVAALVEAQCITSPWERRAVNARHLEVHQPDPALVERGEVILWNLRDLPRVEAIGFWVKTVQTVIWGLTHIPEEERV